MNPGLFINSKFSNEVLSINYDEIFRSRYKAIISNIRICFVFVVGNTSYQPQMAFKFVAPGADTLYKLLVYKTVAWCSLLITSNEPVNVASTLKPGRSRCDHLNAIHGFLDLQGSRNGIQQPYPKPLPSPYSFPGS